MTPPKLKINLSGETGALIKHLLPFVNLVATSQDRNLAINLLGFNTPQDYILAFAHDRRYGDMLAIIIFLFMLDEPEEKKVFWDTLTFFDKVLENRLRELCGIDDNTISAQELDAIWDLKFP